MEVRLSQNVVHHQHTFSEFVFLVRKETRYTVYDSYNEIIDEILQKLQPKKQLLFHKLCSQLYHFEADCVKVSFQTIFTVEINFLFTC